MNTNANKKKEANLLLLKKENNYATSIQELKKVSMNFHLNTFHKKYNSKTGRLYNNYNNDITKTNNNRNKFFENSIINTYIKTSSPNTHFKNSNIDVNNSNNDMANKISTIKAKYNISNREYQKDLQNKKIIHHKKIKSNIFSNYNQIFKELLTTNTTSNSNKAKDSIINNKNKKGSKIIRKKLIQIDTNNINNNANTKEISNKINNPTNINNNNQHKINLKIYLEKHKRVLSTDSSNNNKSIKVNSKNKKNDKHEKYEKKNNINSVIKNKRIINNKNSTSLLNNYNLTNNNTLSRANSSWLKNENNIFNSSIEHNISKNIQNKMKNKIIINNVILKNINKYKNEKKFRINDDIELENNDLFNLNKLKEKTTLCYLTNISGEFKTKKKRYNNGNNIFISINNYSNVNKKNGNKNNVNVNLTEGKELNIQNYMYKKTKSQKEDKDNEKIRRRNYLKKNDNKFKILVESKNYSQNKTEENLNSYNSENDNNIQSPELTHFFIVKNIQKGIQNNKNFN